MTNLTNPSLTFNSLLSPQLKPNLNKRTKTQKQKRSQGIPKSRTVLTSQPKVFRSIINKNSQKKNKFFKTQTLSLQLNKSQLHTTKPPFSKSKLKSSNKKPATVVRAKRRKKQAYGAKSTAIQLSTPQKTNSNSLKPQAKTLSVSLSEQGSSRKRIQPNRLKEKISPRKSFHSLKIRKTNTSLYPDKKKKTSAIQTQTKTKIQTQTTTKIQAQTRRQTQTLTQEQTQTQTQKQAQAQTTTTNTITNTNQTKNPITIGSVENQGYNPSQRNLKNKYLKNLFKKRTPKSSFKTQPLLDKKKFPLHKSLLNKNSELKPLIQKKKKTTPKITKEIRKQKDQSSLTGRKNITYDQEFREQLQFGSSQKKQRKNSKNEKNKKERSNQTQIQIKKQLNTLENSDLLFPSGLSKNGFVTNQQTNLPIGNNLRLQEYQINVTQKKTLKKAQLIHSINTFGHIQVQEHVHENGKSTNTSKLGIKSSLKQNQFSTNYPQDNIILSFQKLSRHPQQLFVGPYKQNLNNDQKRTQQNHYLPSYKKQQNENLGLFQKRMVTNKTNNISSLLHTNPKPKSIQHNLKNSNGNNQSTKQSSQGEQIKQKEEFRHKKKIIQYNSLNKASYFETFFKEQKMAQQFPKFYKGIKTDESFYSHYIQPLMEKEIILKSNEKLKQNQSHNKLSIKNNEINKIKWDKILPKKDLLSLARNPNNKLASVYQKGFFVSYLLNKFTNDNIDN
ncbi:hypothetical protein M0813_07789 [Anaeramoeba flamelloides]|uniref:Uncharacterized protein n=1 Tax=Anaeramoeba flamelloides TaxID=1746091 RepID=A0ABQ8XE25_9EUKA|nr:hypothetical protein M0813_07789 [Anaeramoeba flamelloides]